MPESVPVRCPVCGREHVHIAPSYPCACGAPTAPRLDPAAEPVVAAHRAWDDEWITVPCAACGRPGQWPRPELGCPCGTTLHIPVTRASTPAPRTTRPQDPGHGTRPPARPADPGPGPGSPTPNRLGAPEPRTPPPARPEDPAHPAPLPPPAKAHAGRTAFQPRPIHTARDAVTTAVLYLRWLGYRDIRRADQRPPRGIGLAARGLLAQVDPAVRPAATRDVECLWLTAMTESAGCVYFSLAGYTGDARSRADDLGVPLFLLDLTGTPRPVNTPAGELSADGA